MSTVEAKIRPQPAASMRLPRDKRMSPLDMPGLISFWDFQDAGKRKAKGPGKYALEEMAGAVARVEVPGAPFGPYAARIQDGQWFRTLRKSCPLLNRSGKNSSLTVLAWLRRFKKSDNHCEFIAGQWNETHLGRQYGLFLNIATWGGRDQICGHVSHFGGPTPGYIYCMDGALGATPVSHDTWHMVGMSYDGTNAMAWLDGLLDRQDELNPYSYSGGLHNGGAKGSDFTVGAVHRSGEMGNFFAGDLGGLAIFDRALSPAEIYGLTRTPG